MYQDQYEAPDIARENYEAIATEERIEEEDRYTTAELKELEKEEEERDAREQAQYEQNMDFNREAKMGAI